MILVRGHQVHACEAPPDHLSVGPPRPHRRDIVSEFLEEPPTLSIEMESPGWGLPPRETLPSEAHFI